MQCALYTLLIILLKSQAASLDDATESAKKETRESWNKEGQRYEEEPDSIGNYINIQINIFGNLCTSVAWNSPFYICVMMPIDRVQ